jgi:hypothetical protein
MIKRLVKSKKSKKGAILVIVVLILALAMIFIASAMMLTQATRRRLYSTAYQSQARLTVTAASEVFLEALKMQEITDNDLEAIMGKTHGTGKTKVKMCVPNVPGMSEAENNCTYLDIYPDPTDGDFIYCDFSTTIGDTTENVQVVLKSESSDPVFGSQFKNQIEVAGGVGIAELKFTSGVGMWNPAIGTPTDNNVVMRGGVYAQTSDSQFFSDVVFGNDSTSIALGGGDTYHNKLIFLDGAKMVGRSTMSIKGDIYFIGKTGDAPGMGLNSSGNIDLWGDAISGSNFIFSNRSVQNDTNDGNGKIRDVVKKTGRNCYFVDSAGNCIKSGETKVQNKTGQKGSSSVTYDVKNAAYSSVPSDIVKNVKRYQGWNYSQSSNPFPTADSVFSKLCPDGDVLTSDGTVKLDYDTYSPTGETFTHGTFIPNGKKYIVHPVTKTYPSYKYAANSTTPSKILNINTITSDTTLTPGYYYVQGSNENESAVRAGGESYRYKPIVIAIDGSRGDEYRFYFKGNTKFYLRGIIFAIYNPDETKPVLVILESGAKIQLGHNNDKLDADGGKNVLCSCGFISVPGRQGCGSASQIASYIRSHNWESESKKALTGSYWSNSYKKGSTVIDYSKYYDSIARPCFFIYGVGSNAIALGPNVTIEAYVGLYGQSNFGPITGTGGGGPANTKTRQNIYGRIECQGFHTFDNNENFGILTDQSSGDFCMPYCPQPISEVSKPKQRIAKSKYSVADIIYYYE